MGPQVGVGEPPAPASPKDQARSAPEFERQPLRRTWLIGLAAIPFLLAIIGYGAYGRPLGVNGPTGALPTLSAQAGEATSLAPSLSLSLLSISRSGNTLTLIGDFPDDAAKAAMMNSLKALTPPGINVIDQVHIDPLVHSLDFANAEPVFAAAVPIPDFNLTVNKDTVTLGGTAATPDLKDAIERTATTAWPQVNVSNKIAAKGQAGSPTSGPVSCDGLQATVNALTGGPLGFGSDGISLTPETNQILARVADRLKPCPNAKVTVNGYADNSGSEAVNVPLSTQRATTVADYLVKSGLARDRVTAKGLGSTNPIASNDTAEGRAKNRRVELVVS